MLTSLTIKNFGLIDQLTLEFSNRLNILTGETGAGKSILIDALRFVLGERLQGFQVRNPETPCIIEAIFNLENTELANSSLLEDYAHENELIFQRTLTSDGKSRSKINGLTITIGQLKEIGNELIDFHGPHDHQQLLAEHNHIHMIDQLTDFKNDNNSYSQLYEKYVNLSSQLKKIENLASSRDRDIDMLEFQVNELEQISLEETVFLDIESEHNKIAHAEKLFSIINQLQEIFDNEEFGIERQISSAFRPMNELAETDEQASSLLNKLNSLQNDSQELSSELRTYAESLQFDPSTAEEITLKYDIYQKLLRKYGPSISDITNFYKEIKIKYDSLINLEHDDAQLRKDIENTTNELNQLAKKLSNKRKKTAKTLKQTIETELKELGFSHIQFEVNFEKSQLNSTGFDKISFFISPNAGETLKPLAEIVSSGEAARIMLALKKALVNVDPVPVLIFDEIDAQIGGRLGTVTGTKLKEIADARQVILITHLPQIASFAQSHFKITKEVIKDRATTQVKLLTDQERVDEVAQMMSGETKSDISIEHAQEMLTKANQ